MMILKFIVKKYPIMLQHAKIALGLIVTLIVVMEMDKIKKIVMQCLMSIVQYVQANVAILHIEMSIFYLKLDKLQKVEPKRKLKINMINQRAKQRYFKKKSKTN